VTRLKVLRLAAGKTAWDVCREIDMSASRYSYLERGLVPAKPQERAALARLFGVAESALFRPVTLPRQRTDTTVPA